MARQLIHNKPKRIFTFGCSFTHYLWATWANILGVEFPNAEFRNFGRSGAGNSYIFNMVQQADSMYNFTHEDLVIVQWTNVCREDRYLPQKDGWLVPGNIYSQGEYNEEFIKEYFSEMGSYIKDFALMNATREHLKHKTQWHFLQMLDIIDFTDQWDLTRRTQHHDSIKKLAFVYKETLESILPSFYSVLFRNNIDNKFKSDKNIVNKNFQDGHPHVLEHYNYLKSVFKHKWRDETDQAVAESFKLWVKKMNDASYGVPNFSIYSVGSHRFHDSCKYELTMRRSDQIDPALLT